MLACDRPHALLREGHIACADRRPHPTRQPPPRRGMDDIILRHASEPTVSRQANIFATKVSSSIRPDSSCERRRRPILPWKHRVQCAIPRANFLMFVHIRTEVRPPSMARTSPTTGRPRSRPTLPFSRTAFPLCESALHILREISPDQPLHSRASPACGPHVCQLKPSIDGQRRGLRGELSCCLTGPRTHERAPSKSMRRRRIATTALLRISTPIDVQGDRRH